MPIESFLTYTGDQPGGAPLGNPQANPQASNYATDSALSPAETIHLLKSVAREIIMTAPKQYNSLKLLFMKPAETQDMDEFEWTEHDNARAPIVVDGTVSAVPNGGSGTVTATLTVADQDSVDAIGLDSRIQVSATQQVVVTAISGLDLTIRSMSGEAIPEILDGSVLPVLGPVAADQQDDLSQFFRLETITRYNYFQLFFRASKWGRIERQKYLNSGRTDYLQKDLAERIRQLRQDMFVSFWNGQRGEHLLSDGTHAKTMQGVYPAMVGDSAVELNPTLSDLPQAFEQGAFASNRAEEGATKYVYGTDEMLFQLSKAYKENLVRYTPESMVANLNLKAIEMGTMRFVMVPCELFKERSLFRPEWSRRLITLDPNMLTPQQMRGIPMFNMDLVNQSRYESAAATQGSTVKWAEAFFSYKMAKPSHGFILNVQNNG